MSIIASPEEKDQGITRYCLHLYVVRVVLVAGSFPTSWNPMDCNLPGSSVHGDSPGNNTGVGCHSFL